MVAPKIHYVCASCYENAPEQCGYDRTDIVIAPDGRWLCDECANAEFGWGVDPRFSRPVDLATALAREAGLREALTQFLENVEEPPDRNCSCHISPPCNDCIDNSGLREAFEIARAALATKGE